jgi:hypothetical protein
MERLPEMSQPRQAELLRQRTTDFALRIIRLFRALPKTEQARILGRQLLPSATSVAANYLPRGVPGAVPR